MTTNKWYWIQVIVLACIAALWLLLSLVGCCCCRNKQDKDPTRAHDYTHNDMPAKNGTADIMHASLELPSDHGWRSSSGQNGHKAAGVRSNQYECLIY